MYLATMVGWANIYSVFIAACGAIITVSAAVGVVAGIWIKARQKMNEPDKARDESIKKHDERIVALEIKTSKHDEYLKNDDNRITTIEDTNNVLMRSLYAIMSFLVNNQDKSVLMDEMKLLNNYIFDGDKKQ